MTESDRYRYRFRVEPDPRHGVRIRATPDPDAIAHALDRSTVPDNPPTKATIITATILCVGFALMLILIGIAAIIWAL